MKARRGRRTVVNFFFIVYAFVFREATELVASCLEYGYIYIYIFRGRKQKVCILLDKGPFNAISLDIGSLSLD